MSSILQEGDSLAAVDLGSNSFHLVVARYEHGDLRVIDRVRETVRMALGLRPDGTLDPERHRRALSCLARFGQRLRDLPPERVRAVGTNTVRRLRNPRAFLLPAETALGHPISVVPGRAEARLIYRGVAHGLPRSRERRLVVDIGGGSTEFIIGCEFAALETESLQMGCVASTLRFFDDGKLTRKRWQRAQTEIEVELQQFAAAYRA
ncbi:MAG: exopolyphosphatase, partial [Pseudomonadota bacterium]